MAAFTIEKWKCDRCGVVHDKRPKVGWPKLELDFQEHHDVAAGRRVTWKEVCGECHKYMRDLITELSGRAY